MWQEKQTFMAHNENKWRPVCGQDGGLWTANEIICGESRPGPVSQSHKSGGGTQWVRSAVKQEKTLALLQRLSHSILPRSSSSAVCEERSKHFSIHSPSAGCRFVLLWASLLQTAEQLSPPPPWAPLNENKQWSILKLFHFKPHMWHRPACADLNRHT